MLLLCHCDNAQDSVIPIHSVKITRTGYLIGNITPWNLGLSTYASDALGSLILGYGISAFQGTAESVGWGYLVVQNPLDSSSLGCLSLGLKLPSGEDAITTTTHAFVKTGKIRPPFTWKIADWCLRVREILNRFEPIKHYSNALAVVALR